MQSAAATREISVETVDLNEMSRVDTNPLEVRWAFNPVQRDKILDAREIGISVIPFARFFPIRSFKTRRENHSIDWTAPRENEVIVSAEQAQAAIEQSLSGKNAQITTDWGLRTGFIGERDIAKMEVINNALIPDLDTIREICRENDFICPISEICEGADESDFGSRTSCVTCWNRWINSDACARYCEIVAQIGFTVSERDVSTSEVRRRHIRPTLDELEKARAIISQAFRIGIASLQTQWRTIATEEEKGERKAIVPAEDAYRKDLHENKPQDRQVAMVQKFAKANAEANNNQDVIAMLAQSQMQTNQLLGVIVQALPNLAAGQNSVIPPAAPETIEPAESAAKKPQTAEEKAAFVQKMAEAREKKKQEGNKEND